MEFSCERTERLKTVSYFCENFASYIVDSARNTSMHSKPVPNLLVFFNKFSVYNRYQENCEHYGFKKICWLLITWKPIKFHEAISLDTGRKLNEHKTFRKPPGPFLNVLYTFNLGTVSSQKMSVNFWNRPVFRKDTELNF